MKKLLMFVSILCIWISSSSQIISELSRWEYGPTEAVAVKDSTAYISSGSYLWVLDISDESNPALLNEIKLENYISYIRVVGNYLYVSKEDTLLNIYDIHTSDNPVLVNQIEGTDKDYPWKDLYIDGDTIYIGGKGTIQYFLNDTVNLNYIRKVVVGDQMRSYDTIGVTLVKDYEDIRVFSLNQIGDINSSDDYLDFLEKIRGISLNYPYVYFGYGSRGVGVVDVSDIYNIIEKSNHITGGYTYDVELIDDTILIAARGLNGIGIYDIEADTLFTLIGECETNGYPYELQIYGNRLYAGARSGGLIIVDISDLSNPTVLGEYRGYGECRRIALDGDRLYAASGDGGVMIMDITDRESPSVISQCWTRGIAEDVVKQGDYLYVADGDSGLTVVDITDENNPSIAGELVMPYYEDRLDIYNNMIAMGNSMSTVTGVPIIDVSVPSNPVIASEVMSGCLFMDLVFDSIYLHINASGGSTPRYRIIDLENMYAPVYRDSIYKSFSMFGGIYVEDNYSYMQYNDSFYCYDISNVDNIVEINRRYKVGFTQLVRVFGGYLLDHDEGGYFTHIWDYSDPTNPDSLITLQFRHAAMDIEKAGYILYASLGVYEYQQLNKGKYGLSIYGFDTEAPMKFSIINPEETDSVFNTGINVVWHKATDTGIGIDDYEVYVGGVKSGETTDTTLEVTTGYTGIRKIWVVANDRVGNSRSSDTVSVNVYAGVELQSDERQFESMKIMSSISGIRVSNAGTEEITVKVTDISGRIVKEMKVKGKSESEYKPKSGIYFISEKQSGYKQKILIIR